MGLSYYTPDLFPSLFPFLEAMVTTVWGWGEGERVSAWKSPNCMVQSHPRKSRVTSMSCSLCIRIKLIHIESQCTQQPPTTCVHKRNTISILNYPVSFPSAYLYPYFSPLFPNYKHIRKGNVVISRRQRHYFKESLLRPEPPVLISSQNLLPFSLFYVSLLSPYLLPVLIDATCTPWNVPSLFSHSSKKGFLMAFWKSSCMTVCSPISMSGGKYTDFFTFEVSLLFLWIHLKFKSAQMNLKPWHDICRSYRDSTLFWTKERDIC